MRRSGVHRRCQHGAGRGKEGTPADDSRAHVTSTLPFLPQRTAASTERAAWAKGRHQSRSVVTVLLYSCSLVVRSYECSDSQSGLQLPAWRERLAREPGVLDHRREVEACRVGRRAQELRRRTRLEEAALAEQDDLVRVRGRVGVRVGGRVRVRVRVGVRDRVNDRVRVTAG